MFILADYPVALAQILLLKQRSYVDVELASVAVAIACAELVNVCISKLVPIRLAVLLHLVKRGKNIALLFVQPVTLEPARHIRRKFQHD